MANRFYRLLTLLISALLPAMIMAQTQAADSAVPSDTTPSEIFRHSPIGKNHKTVAVISSFTSDAPWSNDHIPTVTMAAASYPNTYCEVYYLNSILITDSIKYNQVKRNMFENFKWKKPDYVVMIGKMAFTMRDAMKEKWGDIPMLLISNSDEIAPLAFYFAGVNTIDDTDALTAEKLVDLQQKYNMSAVVVPYFVKETVELMVRTMSHDIEELVLVAGPSYFERQNSMRISEYLMENYPGIRFRWVSAQNNDVAELRSYMLEKKPGTGVLLSNWATLSPGPFGYPIITNRETKLLATAVNPVFVTSESLMNNGAVGGVFYDKDVVNYRLTSLIDRMLRGDRMADIPIYTCTRSKEVLNYEKAVKFNLELDGLDSDVEIIGQSRSFWQKYHWETILTSIVILLVIFMFCKRNQLQNKQIKTLQMHSKFVADMPVAYAHLTLYLSADGKSLNNVVYSDLNDAMQDVIDKNGCKTGEYVLFPLDAINSKAQELFEKGDKIEFIHNFEATDTYYDVFMDIVDRDKNERNRGGNIREIDIFAVDVTNRVRMEKELKTLSRKLDLTINVTGLIPWEWDIKTDVIRFDAYSLFGRKLHDVDDMQDIPGTYLDVCGEFMPLIHAEDVGQLEKLRQDILTKKTTSFTIRYRLCVVRDGMDAFQWVEVRGSVTEFDAKGNPSICAGGMWNLYDDIVSAPLD